MSGDTPSILIDVMRHGEPEGGTRFRGSTDDPLSETGWRQMREGLGGPAPWRHILSSPLQRCRAFAEELAGANEIAMTIEPDLREMHFGTWEGRTAGELMASEAEALGRFWDAPFDNPPPGAEPPDEFRRRVLGAWEKLIKDPPARHLLIVSHGGPIRLILGQVLGLPDKNLLRLELPHAALSRIRIGLDAVQRPLPSLVFHAGRP